MATRVWNEGEGDWSDPAQWTTTSADPPGAPEPGDTASIATGSAEIVGAEGIDGSIFDGVALSLGDAADDPARLILASADLGHFFSIQAEGSAAIIGTGTSAIAGSIAGAGAGTALTLVGGRSSKNGLLLTHGGSVSVQAGARLDLDGLITDEAGAGITTAAGSTVAVDGVLKVVGSSVDIGGSLEGHGTIRVADAATVILGGSVSSGETIGFPDLDGRLEIADPSAFAGTIRGFGPGDQIDFTGLAATGASYDAATKTLTLTDGSGAVVASLANVFAAQGALAVTSDAGGGTTVRYAGAPLREQYQIADADWALRSNVVRETTTVPGTATPITGAGIKIGIISTSFDALGTASDDAAAGYLPSDPGVTVIGTDPKSDDEGREMAEEIHQIAPGAQIYFAAASDTQASLANAVDELAGAGCNIIANDITPLDGPLYQVTGGLDAAVSSAIAANVNIFTSGGNFGQSFLEQSFTPQATTLPDGAGADAEIFDDGQSSDRITVQANTSSRIDLQWTAPYEGVGGSGAADALTLEVFAADGTLLGTGAVADEDGVATTDRYFDLPTATTTTDYRVAVVQNGGQASPSAFKMILSTDAKGRSPGGTFDDPEAGEGSGDERGIELLPGVNSVGASYFANSGAFDHVPSDNEFFSSQGPGTLLYDAAGNPLSSPESAGKIDFDAPDGVYVPAPDETDPNDSPTAFYGTSAAAPNAAAVAALMLQANPNLTTAQVTALLEQSAIGQGLPAAQQGAGLIQADRAVALAIAAIPQAADDAISVDPDAAFAGDGTFVLTGHAASPAGVGSVEFTAEVDGVERSIGAATVAADGSFSFVDHVDAHFQSDITATERDGAGAAASALARVDLSAGITGEAYRAEEDRFDPATGTSLGAIYYLGDGREYLAGAPTAEPDGVTSYTYSGGVFFDGRDYSAFTDSYASDGTFVEHVEDNRDGSHAIAVEAPYQTIASIGDDVFQAAGQANTTFVFTPGFGTDVVDGFIAGGAAHDAVSFASSDFASIADVLRHTRNTADGAVIHDPTSGDVVQLSGVSKTELVHAKRDVTLHA